MDPRDEIKLKKGEAAEEVESIVLNEDEPEKTVQVGKALEQGIKEELIDFLRRRQSVFAWSHADMPGIDPEIMTHKLNVDGDARPIK